MCCVYWNLKVVVWIGLDLYDLSNKKLLFVTANAVSNEALNLLYIALYMNNKLQIDTYMHVPVNGKCETCMYLH